MASQPIRPGSRLRQASWAAVLSGMLGLFLALTFHVNAIKSEVRLAERRIVSLERERMLLETEFESRASQRQLAEWNAVEFGYLAPRADQFLDDERELASLGTPLRADAPQPVRIARAARPAEDDGALADWVSPLTGQPMAAEAREPVIPSVPRSAAKRAASLAERLAASGPGPGAIDTAALGERGQ